MKSIIDLIATLLCSKIQLQEQLAELPNTPEQFNGLKTMKTHQRGNTLKLI
jgi:hypothetical protein